MNKYWLNLKYNVFFFWVIQLSSKHWKMATGFAFIKSQLGKEKLVFDGYTYINWVYTPNFGLKIRIFLRFASPQPPPCKIPYIYSPFFKSLHTGLNSNIQGSQPLSGFCFSWDKQVTFDFHYRLSRIWRKCDAWWCIFLVTFCLLWRINWLCGWQNDFLSIFSRNSNCQWVSASESVSF